MKECFPHSQFTKTIEVASTVRKGYMQRKDIATICPSCDKDNTMLKHGESLNCACGATLQLLGNALYCSAAEDVRDFDAIPFDDIDFDEITPRDCIA